jgi:3-methyladenine DNA glycosylase AlkD
VNAEEMADLVARRLAAAADPAKAATMAAHMKTATPFYGVQKPDRVPILKEAVRDFSPESRADYRATVFALWSRPHREERYLAIEYASAFPQYITASSLPLYRKMIVEGAWWDFVDALAIHLVGEVLVHQRDATTPKVTAWIDHPDLWLRRTSIICQIGRKASTDTGLLFDACERRMHEQEFFIRKAVGWALRDFAKTDPDAVLAFVAEHRHGLSGLSFREATKHLDV